MGCKETLAKISPEVYSYLRDKAGVDFDGKTGEGKEAWAKVAKELREHTLNNLHDIYNQAGVKGYEQPSKPIISEKVKNKLSQLKSKKDAEGFSQPVWENVLTPTGFIEIGKIKEGDFVMGDKGLPVLVEKVYPKGLLNVFKLVVEDGSSVYASGDHLWPILSGKRLLGNSIEILRTASISDKIKHGIIVRLPVIQPIQYAQKDLIVKPYTLGVILGDGTVQGNWARISSMDESIMLKNEKEHPIEFKRLKNGAADILIWRLLFSKNEMRELGMTNKSSFEKRIPINYMFSTIEDRIELLRGLMDTDGSITRRNEVVFASANQGLAIDVRNLVLSLGGVATINSYKPSPNIFNGRQIKSSFNITYRVRISINENPFFLPRKSDKWKIKLKTISRRIISITKLEEDQECVCIKVDNQSSLYITNDYLITHNTKNNANTQSAAASNQTGVQQSSKPEYARTEQTGSEGKATGPESSDSDKRGEGRQEKVTPLNERLEKVREQAAERSAEEERTAQVAHDRAVQLVSRKETSKSIQDYRDKTGVTKESASDVELLKNISEQAQNVTGGERNETGNRQDAMRTTIESAGEHLVEAAMTAYPLKTLLKPKESASKKESVVPEHKTGDNVSGTYYRVSTGFTHDRGATAKDVLDYEADELENEDGINARKEIEKLGIDLSKYPAKDVIWVTKTKAAAARYGGRKNVENEPIENGTVIIPDDGDGGMLILKNKSESEPVTNKEVPIVSDKEVEDKYNKDNNVDLDSPIQYHGTTEQAAANIKKEGFFPQHDVNITDSLEEAQEYAEINAADVGGKPAVIKVRLKKGAKSKAEPNEIDEDGNALDEMAYDAKDVVLDYSEVKSSTPESKPKSEVPIVSDNKATEKIAKRKVRDEKLRKDIDSALDDLMGDSGGITLSSGGLDPEKIEKAVKVIGLYMKAGVYKFVDIIEDMYAKYGAKAENLFRAMKTAYLDYYSSDATEDEAGKMDLNIRQHTFESIIQNLNKLDGPRDFIDAIKEKIGNKEKLNIVSIRKLAAQAGIGNLKDTELQEMTELAIVEMAKDIAMSNESAKDRYDKIVDLYNAQPTISMRSSERIAKQQYSTPIPLSFLMGEFINAGNPNSVLEPNAGNGMLAIGIPSNKVIANEIDPVRLEMLSEQGFKMVTGNDATNPFPFKVDAVIMNPPFGGKPAQMFDGVPISGLDEQMVANSLLALNKNGRGAIIIGGHNEYDEKGRLKGDRIFFNYLYNRYNVSDVINVDGNLYSKQGTSFPVRIILINGVKENKEGNAPLVNSTASATTPTANAPVTNFEDLFKRIYDGNILNANQQSNNIQSPVDAKSNNGDVVHGRSAQQGANKNQESNIVVSAEQNRLLDKTKQDSQGKTVSDDRGLANNLSNAGRIREGEFDRIDNADRALDESGKGVSGGEISGNGIDEATGDTGVQGSDTLPVSDRTIDILNEKATYQPKSKGKSVDTVMPSQMATETYHTLDAIEDIYGNIDNFVGKELGYKTKDDLFKALSAEQVDAVAIAIHQLKSGQGMIIGDMTGVGKGRIAAAIVRYAVKNGYKPIFLTEKPNLFSDLHRDMVAIGSDDLKPFIVNDKNAANNPDITNEKGQIVHKSFGGSQKKDILNSDRIPEHYDFTVATYSQFRKALDKPSVKRDFFLRNAQDNILIMDESHNASGESNSGAIFQDLLPNTKGVVFLSATFAKRPDNMPVYAMKTAMSDANMSKDELVAAIQRGGVALQEVVAANLVQSGQMIRRERSFDGVKVDYNVLEEHKEDHTKTANSFTAVVRDIIDFEKQFVLPVMDDIDSELAAQGATAGQTKGVRAAGISNTPFASKTFNLINQMLFAIKAKEIAKAAIQAHKEGKKPVIGFLSTMESFLNSMGVTVGEKLDKADFALVLKRGLDGTMRYTIRDGVGNNTPATLSLSELTEEGRREYDKILKNIRAITSGISISPIDVMIKELQDAGLRVGEITGRKLYLDIQDDGSAIVKERKDKDINKTGRAFNNGDTDVILLNASGATGLSLHSSSTFADQKPRVLISGQLELDINKEVQKRGRVDRTGQVHRAEYQYIVSAIPAEQRLLMMFKAKLKSLDANTTSSQKSKSNALDIVDFLNKYGDEVVTQYVKENTDFNEKIQDPFGLLELSDDNLSEIKRIENAASRVTGRVAILSTKEQEAFYSDIIEAYTSYLNYLKDNNENDLEVKMLPLNATTKSSVEVIAGRGTNSPFGMPSTRETVEVDVLTKPMKKEEIDNEINRLLDGKTPKESRDELLKEIAAYEESFIDKKTQKIEDTYTKEIIPQTLARVAKRNADITPQELEEVKQNLIAAKEHKIERERLKYQVVFGSVENVVRTFTAGEVFSIPMSTRVDTNTFFSKGVFMGFHIKESATNKYTPSNIIMKFAVNDSRRIVSVPVSKTDYVNAIIVNSRYIDNKKDIRDNWDSKISNKTRATRYIITGNLLQAYGTNDGQLVSYTTDNGTIRKGMLLPDNYEAEKQKFRTTISRAFTEEARRIVSTDGEVAIDKEYGGYTIEVPLSKQRGGKYFLDDELRALVNGNDFRQRGGKMEGFVNENNIRQLLLRLDALGVTVDNEMGKASFTEAKKSFADKARDVADKIENEGLRSALPGFLKANLPEGTEEAGFAGNKLFDKAVAKAIRLVADAIEAGQDFANAIKIGFEHLKEYYAANTKSFDEDKIRESFIDHVSGIFEPQYNEIKDIVQDLINEGNSIKSIQKIVADELGDTKELKKVIEKAYNKLTAKAAQEEPKTEEPQPKPEPIIEEEAEGPLRRFTKQVLTDEAIIPKAQIAEKLVYVRQSNAMSIEEATDIINQIGVDSAWDLVLHDKDLNGAVRSVMGQMLIRKFNHLAANATDEETRNYYIDKTVEAADFVTEKLATDAGQQIQAFKLYAELSPEAQLRSAIKDIKAQAEKRKKRRNKDLLRVARDLNRINEETAEELLDSASIDEAVESTEKTRVERAEDKVQKARDRRQKLIEQHKANKGQNLYSAAPGLTSEGIEFVGNLAKTYIDEGLANLEIIAGKIINHLQDITGKNVDAIASGNIRDIVQPLLEKVQNERITSGLKDLEAEIHRIIREHYTVTAEQKGDLIDKFMDQAGLEREDATELAASIEKEFDKIATRKKQELFEKDKNRLNRITKGLAGAKTIERKTLEDEIIRLSNLGTVDNETLLKLLADKLGTGKLSPEQGKRILFLAERIKNAPEGSPKREAVEDLLVYREKLKGTSLGEVAQGVWYANVLSGYLTHIKNIVSTFFNGFAFFTVQVAKDPLSLSVLLYGGARGFKRGAVEAWHTITTGRSPIHIFKVETPNVLERVAFKGGLLNPANYLKYVGRLMVAEDVLQFQGLKEMRATQLAYREAKKEGHRNPFSKATWEAVNEKLLNTKERLEEATEQAAEEGFTGRDAQRRISELMELSRPIQMTNDAYGFAAKGTFNHDTEGTLGAITDAIARLVDSSLAIGGAKPLRFVIPFTRIITNVANNAIDFSPLGFVRAGFGRRGLLASAASGKRREMTKEERIDAIVKASLGIASMAALYGLAKLGTIAISGAGPDDYKKRQQLIEEGWQPFSIKIGGKWFSYKLTPMVFAWGVVGSVRDNEEYGREDDTAGKRVALAAWDGVKLISDMTWINSAAPVMSAISSGSPNEAGAIISNSGKNIAKGFFLPNAYTQGAERVEQIFSVPQKQANNMFENLIMNVPIARNFLDDKINALGDPIVKDVDILVSSEVKDPVWKFLLDNKGWVAPVNKNTIIVYDLTTKQERPINNDEYYLFSKSRGQKMRAAIQHIMDVGVYTKLNDKNERVFTINADDATGLKSAAELTNKELNKVLTLYERRATDQTKKELNYNEPE